MFVTHFTSSFQLSYYCSLTGTALEWKEYFLIFRMAWKTDYKSVVSSLNRLQFLLAWESKSCIISVLYIYYYYSLSSLPVAATKRPNQVSNSLIYVCFGAIRNGQLPCEYSCLSPNTTQCDLHDIHTHTFFFFFFFHSLHELLNV